MKKQLKATQTEKETKLIRVSDKVMRRKKHAIN